LRPVYYLIATFESTIGSAVLEIPVSISGENIGLEFLYRVSSIKIKLSVWKSEAGQQYKATVSTTIRNYNSGQWNVVYVPLSSDVEAVWLVAKKIVVTTTVEYILVNSLKLAEAPKTPQGKPLILLTVVLHTVSDCASATKQRRRLSVCPSVSQSSVASSKSSVL